MANLTVTCTTETVLVNEPQGYIAGRVLCATATLSVAVKKANINNAIVQTLPALTQAPTGLNYYKVDGRVIDGSNYFKLLAGLGPDEQELTVCMFLRVNSAVTNGRILANATGAAANSFEISADAWDDTPTGNKIVIVGEDLGASVALGIDSTTYSTHGIKQGEWFSLLFSWDGQAAAEATYHLYLNNIDSDDAHYTPAGPHTLDLGVGAEYVWLGRNKDGSFALSYELSHFYYLPTYTDFSSVANRAKFIDATTLRPVYLGATGEIPFGIPYHHNQHGNLGNNVGVAPNWTEIGTVAPSATSPTTDNQGTTAQSLTVLTQVGTGTYGPGIQTGVIAQTLASLTQSARDTHAGSIAQTLPALVISIMDDVLTLSDSVLFTDQVVTITSYLYEDTFTVSGTYDSYDQTTVLSSTFTVTDSFVGTDYNALLSSAVKFQDTQAYKTITSLDSTVNWTDSFASIGRLVELESAFTITEELVTSVATSEDLSSTFRMTEEVTPGQSESLTSTFLILSSEVATTAAAELLTSTVNLSSSFVGDSATYTALLSSTVQFSDTQNYAGSTYREILASTFSVREVLWAQDFGALAWVMNTETAGLSSYDNFGFNSIVAFEGKLYATSPLGIYEIYGESDDGRNIDAHTKSGLLDFSVEEKKRISDIFVSYTGGPLECEVEAYDLNTDTVYTYDMEEREADAPRNSRIKVGKGISSRYWRFTFSNVDGADFQTQDVTIELGVSNRRL